MEKQGLKLQRSPSIILVAFVFFLGISRATIEQVATCKTSERPNEIININETRRVLGDAVRVLRGVELKSSQECKAECCSNSNCSVYVFYNRRQSSYNCFLVRCFPRASCVYSKLTNSTVGIREPSDVESTAENLVNNFDSRKQNREQTPTTVMVLVTNVTSQSEGNETINGTTTPVTTPGTTPATSTPSSLIQEKHAKNKNNHTTVASLIIALCFGILFLFAVVLLIGRPWWDSFHRPRYSKVDYLMNGL